MIRRFVLTAAVFALFVQMTSVVHAAKDTDTIRSVTVSVYNLSWADRKGFSHNSVTHKMQQVKKWYDESSYGKSILTFTVHAVTAQEISRASQLFINRKGQTRYRCPGLLSAGRADWPQDGSMYVMEFNPPCDSTRGHSWSHMAFNGGVGPGVVQHELGHNLRLPVYGLGGLAHDGKWNCGRSVVFSLAVRCSTTESGNYWSTMGGINGRAFPPFTKIGFGWLAEADGSLRVLNLDTGVPIDETVTLERYHIPLGVRAVKLFRGSRWFYLSYRSNEGMDGLRPLPLGVSPGVVVEYGSWLLNTPALQSGQSVTFLGMKIERLPDTPERQAVVRITVGGSAQP